ncbi:MAG TPA: Na+/H+ antiporter [Gemmatimonadaceae bacterium]|nr:Na+/H+ antiporter [Gemmatimonadaceae bacterium]
MASLELVLLLLAVSAALRVLAQRWHLPHPVLLVFGGVLLAFIPGLPRVTLNPDVVFLIFIPPLLYSASITTSLRDFRAEIWPILRLAVVLVLVTIGAVAVTAHWLTPEFSWPAAFVLAAIVSPPDPIAAIAVMRPLGAPAALVSILEGEGLLNDATALVAFRVAVAVGVTGMFSAGDAALRLLLTGAAGVVIGLAIAVAIGLVRRFIRGFTVVEITLSLLTPFVAYLIADRAGASGVLAVVASGLYLAHKGSTLLTAATRLQSDATWAVVTFLLESLVFILIGLELPDVLRALQQHSLGTLLWYGAAVSIVVIVVRLLWVFPSAYIPALLKRLMRPRGAPAQPFRSWRWVVFAGWAGMRGGDSLVIALAVPFVTASGTFFPARDLIIFVTFAVIFVTLVLQGLSLAPLLRVLRLHEDDHLNAEEAHARRVAAQAGLQRLDELADRSGAAPEVIAQLRHAQQAQLRQWAARDRTFHGADDDDHRPFAGVDVEGSRRDSARYRALRRAIVSAERRAIIQLRDLGEIGDDILRRIQRDLDLETVLAGTDETRPADADRDAEGVR